jgi:2-oxoglutarate dehydrogenase E1 component
MAFRKDVVVDIICFRKLGHNEQDTPSHDPAADVQEDRSQHPGTRQLYADKLAAQGLGATLGEEMVKAYRAAMDEGRHTIDPVLTNYQRKHAVDWSPYLGKKWTDGGDTAIPLAEWKRLADRLTTLPDSISPHQLVKKVICRSRCDGPWRGQCGLGHGRAHGVRLAGGLGLPGAPVG